MDDHSDVMRVLSRGDLRAMLNVLKENYPRSIRTHHLIFNFLLHFKEISGSSALPIISDRWNIRFYGHRWGNIKNCTLVTVTGVKDCWITVFTLEKSARELKECITLTKRIPWNHSPLTISVDSEHFNAFNGLSKTIHSDWKYDKPELIMYISKEEVLEMPVPNIPTGMYLGAITKDHLSVINEAWSHKYYGSTCLIEQSIELNGGLGLFRTDNGELVTWVLTNDYFSPGFLFTVDSERRKGFGSFVLIMEAKRLAEKYNVDTFTYVVEDNSASIEMHHKLGFTVVNKVLWIER